MMKVIKDDCSRCHRGSEDIQPVVFALSPNCLESDTAVPMSSSLTETKPGVVPLQSLKSDSPVPISSSLTEIKLNRPGF